MTSYPLPLKETIQAIIAEAHDNMLHGVIVTAPIRHGHTIVPKEQVESGELKKDGLRLTTAANWVVHRLLREYLDTPANDARIEKIHALNGVFNMVSYKNHYDQPMNLRALTEEKTTRLTQVFSDGDHELEQALTNILSTNNEISSVAFASRYLSGKVQFTSNEQAPPLTPQAQPFQRTKEQRAVVQARLKLAQFVKDSLKAMGVSARGFEASIRHDEACSSKIYPSAIINMTQPTFMAINTPNADVIHAVRTAFEQWNTRRSKSDPNRIDLEEFDELAALAKQNLDKVRAR